MAELATVNGRFFICCGPSYQLNQIAGKVREGGNYGQRSQADTLGTRALSRGDVFGPFKDFNDSIQAVAILIFLTLKGRRIYFPRKTQSFQFRFFIQDSNS